VHDWQGSQPRKTLKTCAFKVITVVQVPLRDESTGSLSAGARGMARVQVKATKMLVTTWPITCSG
jgi:hypothetical protein